MAYRFILLILFILLPDYVFAGEPYEVTLTKHMALAQRYPDDAKLYGIEGDAIVRVRIAPNGKILRYWVLEEPDHPSLKKAVNDMLKRANPAPRVPKEYLKGDPFVELIFPIAFRVHAKPGYLDEIDKRFQNNVKKAYGQQSNADHMPEEPVVVKSPEKPKDILGEEDVPTIPVVELPHMQEGKQEQPQSRQSIIKGTFD